MLYWVFDLDETLYDLHGEPFRYEILERNNHLNNTLSILPHKKIIFTNGTHGHAIDCLKRLNIIDNFSKIVARDTMNDLKPRTSAFNKFISENNIKSFDKCVFFEDSVNNLIEAKKHGWITVYISKNEVTNKYFIPDFHFPNIQIAINFFISQIYK